MSKKSIAIVRRYSGYGGIEHQIENIISGLKKERWQVLLISDKESLLTKRCSEMGSEIKIISFSNRFKAVKEISKCCRMKDIQMIQSHMLRESLICSFVKLFHPNIKNIFRVHTYIDCSHISKAKKNVYHLICWLMNPLIDVYLPINNYNINEMRRRTHIPKRKIRLVHDMVRYPLDDAVEKSFIRNGNIAMIANFVDFKGHDVLIEGIRILKDRGYNIVAYLIGGVPGAGTGHEDNRRYNIVKQLVIQNHLEENIKICGYSSNIPEAIKDCEAVVLPSDSEGTPNVLLEAMILKKVVVASKVGGVPEFVFEGKTGFLHPAGNPQAFADAMERMYHTSEEKISNIIEEAAALVEKNYSVSNVMRKLLEIYDELIK